MSDHEPEETEEPRELSDDELDDVAGGSVSAARPDLGGQ